VRITGHKKNRWEPSFPWDNRGEEKKPGGKSLNDLFDDENAMTRIDMSVIKNIHSVSRLVSASGPWSYGKGQLTSGT
jgi:hypothetical protein